MQICNCELDQDVFRLHLRKDRDMENVEVYLFQIVVFGLNQLPFVLGATLEKHLCDYKDKFLIDIADIKRSLFWKMPYWVEDQ